MNNMFYWLTEEDICWAVR